MRILKVITVFFVISIIFLLMITPVFASEELKAVTSTSTGSLSMYRATSKLYPENSNVDGSVTDYSYTLENGIGVHCVEFDWFTYKALFRSSTKYYAYKVVVEPSSDSTFNYSNINWRMGVASFGDTFAGDISFSGPPVSKQTIWVVTDYKDINYNLVLYADCLQYSYYQPLSSGTPNEIISRTDPELGFDIDYTYTITPYTKDDLSDEILSAVQTNNNLTSTEIAKLETLIANSNLTNENLSDLMEDVTHIDYILLKLYYEAIKQGQVQYEDLPTDNDVLTESQDKEAELIEQGYQPSEVEQSLEFNIDTSASNSVWDIVTRAFNSNVKVFGLVITSLSAGVIKLIFNR